MRYRLSTGALARRSARRPWLTIGAWVGALVVAGFLIVSFLGDALTTEADVTSTPESRAAELLVEERMPPSADEPDEVIAVRSGELSVDDPAFRSHVEALLARAATLGAEPTSNYYSDGDESLVSSDRDTMALPLRLSDDSDSTVESLVDEVAAANGDDGFQTAITGPLTADVDFNTAAEEDLQRGEMFGIGIALLVLLVVFGALVASLVPILLALVSIFVGLGLTALVGAGFELSFFVVNMLVMMGLAVGIDYALFVVSRYREERAKGLEKLNAITAAGSTASRAVLFSGVTVVLALVGMFLIPSTIFRSLAVGAILVVLVTVAAALTLLPAVLSLLGDRIDALKLPFLRLRAEGGGFWARVAGAVMRRPVVSLVASVAVLVAAAVPFAGINTGFAGVSTLPDSFESKRGFELLDEEFGYGTAPAEIVIDGDIPSPGVQAGIERLEGLLASDESFGRPELTVNDSGDLAVMTVLLAGDDASSEATEGVATLRDDYVPEAFAGTSAEVLVGGDAAENVDFFDITDQYLPVVIAFVLGLSFLLLALAFRSLVVPATSILMNLLSVGAAFGLLVLVFQEGIGTGLFGFDQVETIEAWIPLFLFTVLFGLSMDYHVFLLSRIRERYDQTGDNTGSIAFGVSSTARIITGAALIMVAVFGGFAAGQLVMFEQMGFGLGVAVLLDATIVRSVLVPATMRLLGERNWYLPRRLEWLPDLRVEAARAD
jgi:putative drug exporter of the RND superfamily